MSNSVKGASNPVTHLDSVVPNLPWGDGFDIGSGMNAVTGEILGKGVNPPDITNSTTKSVHYSYGFISSESDLDQELEVSAKGKYNMDGVNLSASAKYINEIKFSDTSVTLVAHYESTFDGYDEAEKYSLNDAAKKAIGDKKHFRSLFGDYFVAARRRGSRFTAVYRCETKSAERLDKFKAKIGADTPEVFSAEGSAKFKRAAKDEEVNIDIQVDAVGFEGSLPEVPDDPDQILKLLEWFMKNEVGVPVRAKLFHYSQLDPQFSAEVAIAPTVFVAIGDLYLTHWKIKDGLNSLPDYYQKKYSKHVSDFETSLSANSNQVATEPKLRKQLAQQANSIYDELRAVLERQDFYFKVLDKVGREPKKDDLITCEDCGPKAWLYGYSEYNQSDAVDIKKVTLKKTHKAVAFVYHYNFNLNPDQDRLIVGWEIRANIKKAGEWKKNCDQILLKDSAYVWVQTDFLGKLDWTFHIYFVDADDYQFAS